MLDDAPFPRPGSSCAPARFPELSLLLRAHPSTDEVWPTLQGGLEAGETPKAGALRKPWEETGLRNVELGACVWMRTHVFPWDGKVYNQQERYLVARTNQSEISQENWTDVEREMLEEWRWWALDEIVASPVTFVPRDLGSLLPQILVGDYPSEPINVGI